MSLSLGSTTIGSLYLGSTKVGAAYLGNVKVYEASVDPYNPLGLPAYTMRFYFGTGSYNPTTESSGFWKSGATWTQVSSNPNVWDYTRVNSNWYQEFKDKLNHERNDSTKLIEILGANTSGIINMGQLFYGSYGSYNTSASWVTSLASVCLFDTRDATTISQMFKNNDVMACDIPDYPINSLVSSVSGMFDNCRAVTGGITSMYTKLSSSANITSYVSTFKNCGMNSTTGSAELANIPSAWKS